MCVLPTIQSHVFVLFATDKHARSSCRRCAHFTIGTLEDQHMEWKPAGQPEHASLNQCQLIVANIGALGTPSRWWR